MLQCNRHALRDAAAVPLPRDRGAHAVVPEQNAMDTALKLGHLIVTGQTIVLPINF